MVLDYWLTFSSFLDWAWLFTFLWSLLVCSWLLSPSGKFFWIKTAQVLCDLFLISWRLWIPCTQYNFLKLSLVASNFLASCLTPLPLEYRYRNRKQLSMMSGFATSHHNLPRTSQSTYVDASNEHKIPALLTYPSLALVTKFFLCKFGQETLVSSFLLSSALWCRGRYW